MGELIDGSFHGNGVVAYIYPMLELVTTGELMAMPSCVVLLWIYYRQTVPVMKRSRKGKQRQRAHYELDSSVIRKSFSALEMAKVLCLYLLSHWV